MSSQEKVVILAIGETGAGKSQNGNAFLQKKDAFEINSQQDSNYFIASAQHNTIDGITRYYIDTQGLNPIDGINDEYIQQMISFLKEWKLGINAFFILINYQNPRFDPSIKLMIKLLNDFFNNPKIWLQTGIIFTRCNPNYLDKKIAETDYCQDIRNYIKNLTESENLNPQIPCFFVDSVNWETDESTKKEYERIYNFSKNNNSISTQKVVCSKFECKNEEEILKKQLIKTDLIDEGDNMKKIFYYEDQKRFKITDWNGNIKFTEPITINSYTEEKLYKVEEEKKIEINKITEEKFKTVKSGRRRYAIVGPRPKYQVHDFYLVTTKYIEYTRKVYTDPDGIVTYSDWVQTDIKAEVEKV